MSDDETSLDMDALNLESSTKNFAGSQSLRVAFSSDVIMSGDSNDQDDIDGLSPSKRSPRVIARPTSYASAATRRRSTQSVKSIQSEANPLAGAAEVEKILLRVENLSGCRPISDKELKEMVEFLSQLENNDFLLECLDEQKNQFLFTSQNLLKLVHDDVVTSIKTKLMMIAMIGPRLTDPKAKMDDFLNLFRFAEEKSKVEEILKARASTLTSAIFKQASPAVAMGGRGGRGMGLGGRGGGGGVRNRSATTVEQTGSSSATASPTRGRSSTSSASYNSGSTGIESVNVSASGTEMPSSSSLNGISEDDEGEGNDSRNSNVQKEKRNNDDDNNDDSNKDTANDEDGRESTITANGGGATGILNLLNRPSRAITFTDKPQKSILSLNKTASGSSGPGQGQKTSQSAGGTGALGGRPRSSSSLPGNNNEHNNSPARGRPPTGLQVSPNHYSRTSSAPSMFTSPGGTSGAGAVAGTGGDTTNTSPNNINTSLSQNNSQTNLSNNTIRSGKSSPYMSASNLMAMDNVSETGVSTKTDDASDIDLDHSDKAAIVTSSLMNSTNSMNTGSLNTGYSGGNNSNNTSNSNIERNRSQTSLNHEDPNSNTPVSRYAKEKGNEPPQVEIIGSSVGVGNLLKAFNNNNNNNTNTNQNPNVAPVNMIPILPGRMSMFSGMGGDRYVLGGLTGAQSAALAANDGSGGDDIGRMSVNSYFGGNSNNNNNNPSSSSSSSNSKSISPRTINFIPSQTPYVANTTAAQAILRPKAAESGIIEAVIRVASAVGLEPKQFLTLEPEGPIEEIQEEDNFNDSCYDLKITTTLCLYSYRELVRQNHLKDYQKVVPGALENHLTDLEFFEKFSMSKEAFAQLAKWKQNDLKKSKFLF